MVSSNAVKKSIQAKRPGIDPQPRLPAEHRTFGQKAADWLTTFCGSWFFIVLLLVYIVIWAYLNIIGWIYEWDPWPFIFLNLTLSCLAAIEAPIILMSQNRQADRDRARSERDYLIDRKAEREIQIVHQEILEIKKMLRKMKK